MLSPPRAARAFTTIVVGLLGATAPSPGTAQDYDRDASVATGAFHDDAVVECPLLAEVESLNAAQRARYEELDCAAFVNSRAWGAAAGGANITFGQGSGAAAGGANITFGQGSGTAATFGQGSGAAAGADSMSLGDAETGLVGLVGSLDAALLDGDLVVGGWDYDAELGGIGGFGTSGAGGLGSAGDPLMDGPAVRVTAVPAGDWSLQASEIGISTAALEQELPWCWVAGSQPTSVGLRLEFDSAGDVSEVHVAEMPDGNDGLVRCIELTSRMVAYAAGEGHIEFRIEATEP